MRMIGFVILVACAWQMTRENSHASRLIVAGFIVGILLLLLPSLPKAYLEQRNRIRGMHDGSFQEFLNVERKGTENKLDK